MQGSIFELKFKEGRFQILSCCAINNKQLFILFLEWQSCHSFVMFFDVSLAICRGLCYRKVSIILTIFLSPISNYILLLLGTGKLSYECGNNADTALNPVPNGERT